MPPPRHGIQQTVGSLGEREVIRRLSRWMVTGVDPDGNVSVGDDCAEMHYPAGGGRSILTTDLLVENVHFLRNTATRWSLLGNKAAGANISDLAAAGSQPKALLIGLSVPFEILIQDLEEFYRGLNETATAAGAQIIGGDTTRGERLVISVTAVGWKDTAWADCLRSSALAGDNLYVTGPLGASRAGVDLLLQPALSKLVSAQIADALIRRHFTPPLRTPVGLCLSQSLERTAVIDISDSLYSEAGLVAAASQVQVELWLDQVPVHPGAETLCRARNIDPQQYALFSGEEYELLFSSPLQLDELGRIFQKNGVKCELAHVGRVIPGAGVILTRNGEQVTPSDETFDHFEKTGD